MHKRHVTLIMSVVSCVAALFPVAVGASPTDGYTAKRDRVKPGEMNVYNISFNGDEDASVDLDTKEDVRLAMQVFDSKGKLVVSSRPPGIPRCAWTPKKGGMFTIKIISSDSHELDYTLEAW